MAGVWYGIIQGILQVPKSESDRVNIEFIEMWITHWACGFIFTPISGGNPRGFLVKVVGRFKWDGWRINVSFLRRIVFLGRVFFFSFFFAEAVCTISRNQRFVFRLVPFGLLAYIDFRPK